MSIAFTPFWETATSSRTIGSGPMSQAIKGLAARVGAGERMALRCWCAPKPCHAELIRDRIAQVLDISPEDLAPRDVSNKRMAQARLF
jgi:hypothetical protein